MVNENEQIDVVKAEGQFQIHVDGVVAGFTEFFEHAGKRVFYHTEVSSEFGGRGLSKILVTDALNQTRADGLHIVAICPLVKAFLTKNHDYDDIVDPLTPDVIKVFKADYAK